MMNREVLPYVTVELNPPPCKRSFSVALRAGELYGVEVDGVYYRANRMKTSWGVLDVDEMVRLVGVVIDLTD